MTPDVSVLVAAFRADHPQHRIARTCLDEALALAAQGRGRLLLLDEVLSGFLRVCSSARVFHQADSMPELIAFVDKLLACSGVSLHTSTSAWPLFRALCLQLRAQSDAFSELWIAAAVLQHQETLFTFDHDFENLLPAQHLHLLSR